MESQVETAFIISIAGVFELSLYFFLLKVVNNLLQVILTTLFLKTYGPPGLPWLYLLTNSLFVLTQIAMMRFNVSRGHAFLSNFCRPLMIGIALFSMLEYASSPIWYLVSLVALILYDINSTQAFADMTGQILPLRDVKKSLPTIYAAGTAGSIISGLGLKFLLDFMGFSQIFLLILIFVIISEQVLSRLGMLISPDHEIKPPASGGNFSLNLSGESFKLAVVLFCVSFMGMLARQLTEFLYASGASTMLGSDKSLASFLGIFGAFTDITVIFFQAFLVGKIFSTVPLGSIMALRAAGMGLLCFIGILFPSIYVILAIQFFMFLMTKAFITSAFVILLEPLPKTSRPTLRRVIAMGDSTANVIAGLFLIFLLKKPDGKTIPIDLNIIFGAILSVCGIVFAVSKWVDSAYTGTVRETLESTEGKGDLEVLKSIRFIPRIDRMARIRELLMSDDQEVRFNAISETAELLPEDASDLLLTHIPRETSPRNFAATFQIILQKLGSDGREIIEDFLSHEHEPRFVADLIEVLIASGTGSELVPVLSPYINHPNHRVRGNALMGLFKTALDPDTLERSLDSLVDMITQPEPFFRATAAVIMGNTGFPMFVPALGHLADDANEDVARNAYKAISSIRTPASLELLASRKSSGGPYSRYAQEAWTAVSQESYQDISRLLKGMTAQERRSLSIWLNNVRDNETFQVIQRIIELEDSEPRDRLISAMHSFDSEKLKMLSRCLTTSDTQPACIEMEPVIYALREEKFKSLPPWAELVTLLGGSDNPAFQSFLLEALKEFWHECIYLIKAKDLKLSPFGRDLGSRIGIFQDRLQILFHLVALGKSDPAKILDAIGKARGTDTFLQSIALEYLEETLGKATSTLLFPLMKWERNYSPLLSDAKKVCGLDPDSLNEDAVLSFFMRTL